MDVGSSVYKAEDDLFINIIVYSLETALSYEETLLLQEDFSFRDNKQMSQNWQTLFNRLYTLSTRETWAFMTFLSI
jgi:hypothetical protein